MRLDSFDNMRPFSVELRCVSVMRLFLAVFQAVALVVFEQTVGSAIVAVTETAVPDDSLRPLLAVFVCAANLLGWHTPAERHGQVESRLSIDIVVCQGT